jgi:hypothetical protein
MKKDWKGNTLGVFSNIGATNHSISKRQNEDYYATEPKAVRLFLEKELFGSQIWENACGEGHLSIEMERMGFDVFSSDLIDRGFGDGSLDFLSLTEYYSEFGTNIISNPPYKYANDFIKIGLQVIKDGYKMAYLLPIRYLEGKSRREIFDKYPPKKIYVSSGRIKCAKNGEFDKMDGSAMSYAWFVWEKGFKGETTLEWFN